MAIFYLDYVNGLDANAGTSWALAWKTLTLGATAARIAPGDTIRIAKSPDPTSLGQNGTWTDGPLLATQNITSSTNATPIVITKVAHDGVTGDTIIINGHTINTKANGVWTLGATTADTYTLLNADGTNSVGNGVGGASGTSRKFNNAIVKLTTAVTANIALFGNQGAKVNWTASANVVNTVITTDYKEGGECQQIEVAAAFTTGLAAYFPTGTLNLSGYQQVSFWIKQTAGTLGLASSCSLVLCSDALGVTAVNTINIPALGALNAWSPITVDLAVALGTSIASIALYVNTDNAAQTFLLDNIIACKASSAADSLSLTSLIGKNSGTEPWLAVQSISGTRVVLDGITASIPAASPQRGYSGTTGAVTTHKRETIKTVMASSGALVQTIMASGTSGSLITFESGYNTATTTIDGETFFDGQNGLGYGVIMQNKTYVSLTVSCARYDTNFRADNAVGSVINIKNASNGAYNIYLTGDNNNDFIFGSACNGNPYNMYVTGSNNNTIAITNSSGNQNQQGVYLTNNSHNNTLTLGTLKNNAIEGLKFDSGSSNNIATITTSDGNGTASVTSILASANYLRYSLLNSATKVGGFTANANSFLWSTNENNNTDTHFGYTDGGLISSDVTTRHTASGISWKLAPTSTDRNARYPLPLKVGTVACAASVAVIFKMWFLRTNTGLTARLICKGGQLSGVAETSSSMTAIANTWEELSVTVTPTQKGVLEFYAECWGGTTYSLFVDDVTIA